MSSNTLGRKGPGNRMPIANWEVDTTIERDALTEASPGKTITVDDIGRTCRVGTAAPFAYYILEGIAPLVWSANLVGGGSGGGADPSDSAPPAIGTGSAGVEDEYSRGDHTHNSPANMATTTQLTNGLATKADATETTDALAEKADAAATEAALAGKADSAATASALAGKADAAATTASLASKADDAATTSALAGKAAVRAEKGFVTSREETASTAAVNGDAGNAVDMNSASPMNFTVNNGVCVKNDLITIYVIAAGVVTLVQGSNVSIAVPPGKTLVSTAAGSVIQLRKRVHAGGGDIWHATGHLA